MSFNHFAERFGIILKFLFQHWAKLIQHTFHHSLLRSSNSALSMQVVKWVLLFGLTWFYFSSSKQCGRKKPFSQEAEEQKLQQLISCSSTTWLFPSLARPCLSYDCPFRTKNDGGNSSSDPCIFYVTTYGAVGDRSTDDTADWHGKRVAVENGVLLAPWLCFHSNFNNLVRPL